MRVIARYIGQYPGIIAGAERAEVRCKNGGEIRRHAIPSFGCIDGKIPILVNRRLDVEPARGLIGIDQLARRHLADLDIRLIEGIDTDDDRRDRRGDLPAEELLPDEARMRHRDPNHRLPRSHQSGKLGLLRRIDLAGQLQMHEQSVVAINFRRAQRLARQGYDSGAMFARRFSQ